MFISSLALSRDHDIISPRPNTRRDGAGVRLAEGTALSALTGGAGRDAKGCQVAAGALASLPLPGEVLIMVIGEHIGMR